VSLGSGNGTTTLGGSSNAVTLGNGNNTVKLSGSDNVVTIGDGNSNVSGGQGNNTIVIGNGNSTESLLGGNSVALGNGNGAVSISGGGNTVSLGNGNGTITVGGSSNAVTLGNGIYTVHGGTADTIYLAATTLNLYGSDEMVFIGTQNAAINSFSTGLNLKLGPTAGYDVVSNFDSPSSTVDLIGGIGGFTTTAAVLSALKSDGHGGTQLSFGPGSSLELAGTAPSQLHASNFEIG
jgi:hypothetical protein